MKKIFAVLLGVLAMVSSAFAALPVAVGTAVTGIQTDGQAIFDLVFPVVAVFVGLSLIITLFKRFTRKI